MYYTKGNEPLGGDMRAILNGIDANMSQITKKWNRKWIV